MDERTDWRLRYVSLDPGLSKDLTSIRITYNVAYDDVVVAALRHIVELQQHYTNRTSRFLPRRLSGTAVHNNI